MRMLTESERLDIQSIEAEILPYIKSLIGSIPESEKRGFVLNCLKDYLSRCR